MQQFQEMKMAHSPSLAGLTVLLVEDQPLIAMDLEEMLTSMGASSVVSVTSTELADREMSVVGLPGLAVLDFALGASSSVALAERLKSQGVPVVFVSGFDSRQHLSDDVANFEEFPLVDKPVDQDVLALAILEAIARSKSMPRD